MFTPKKAAMTLALLLLVSGHHPADAEIYEWTDDTGAAVFSDDPAKVPKKLRKTAKRPNGEPAGPSWVMILENRSGYIYTSFAFYDESRVKRISSIEWVVPVKVIIDNRGLGGIGPTSYYAQEYRLVCSPRSIVTLRNEVVHTAENQIPADYKTAPGGATYHESLIPDQLLNVFCGRYPDPLDPDEGMRGSSGEGR